MAKRTKKIVHTGVTSEQMEQAFSDYAIADARAAKINAGIDEQMTKIREKWADELAKLTERKEKAFDIMQTWAMENRDEVFAKRKSYESTHGTIGFRTGTPKLKTLRGFTWASVTNLLKEFLPSYVRISEEPAKDKLLADRDVPETAELFEKCGFSVVQDETFYVEPKKEENSN
ncbi:MAG TPA: hypothetical protein GXZ87_07545 [Bacteroidales bacterium]|nr:hypothetical protein [Bacteroidales bacterium]